MHTEFMTRGIAYIEVQDFFFYWRSAKLFLMNLDHALKFDLL